MSRNRMKNSQSLHWMGVLKWVLIIGMLAGLGLCYMLCKNQNLHLADQTLRAQRHLDGIVARNAELASDLLKMKIQKLLEKRLALMHSTLIAWGDPRADWRRLDQNTRARVASMGTMPKTSLNLDSVPVAATAQPKPQDH